MEPNISFWLFSEIARVTKNFFLLRRLKRLIIKLDSNLNVREPYIDEMFFRAGKIATSSMDTDYINIKRKSLTILNDKFETKGAFEINPNNTLLVVLAIDKDVVVSRHSNSLKKRYRILYLNLKRDAKYGVIELNSYTYTNLGINNLLKEYAQILLN